jgi:endonuclease/exonuclease/phosphatase family metal-dependent hydrolase
MGLMRPLRLMTYNVRYFGHATRGVLSTRRSIERIAETLAALDPLVDVVCLQEVEGYSLRSSLVTWRPRRPRTQLDVLMDTLDRALARRGIRDRYVSAYYPAHTYRLTRRTNLYTTGLAILVNDRLHVVSHDHGRAVDITHRRRATPRLKQTRICAHLTVTGDGLGQLDVFNTHMSLPGLLYPEMWRPGDRFGFGPNQLSEARRLVETIDHRRSSEDMVLVGDFNSLPGSPVDELLRVQVGLVDALAHMKNLSGEGLRDWSTAGFMNKRMNIDRIYSSPSVEWLDLEGSAPFDPTEDLESSFHGLSDHVPLLGRLRVSSARPAVDVARRLA